MSGWLLAALIYWAIGWVIALHEMGGARRRILARDGEVDGFGFAVAFLIMTLIGPAFAVWFAIRELWKGRRG